MTGQELLGWAEAHGVRLVVAEHSTKVHAATPESAWPLCAKAPKPDLRPTQATARLRAGGRNQRWRTAYIEDLLQMVLCSTCDKKATKHAHRTGTDDA